MILFWGGRESSDSLSLLNGVIASVSITGMFLTGMVPGLMIGLAHCIVAWIIAKRLRFVDKPEKF